MDDEELEFTDHDVFAGCSLCDLPSTPTTTGSMENFLDEVLRSTHACTHMLTCNPPGPDNTHTYICDHTHMQLFAAGEEDDSTDKSDVPTSHNSKKRPLGNCEGVHKYREKKNAHTAYLEAYLEEQVEDLISSSAHLSCRLADQERNLVEIRNKLAGLKHGVADLAHEMAEIKTSLQRELEFYQTELQIGNHVRSRHPLGLARIRAIKMLGKEDRREDQSWQAYFDTFSVQDWNIVLEGVEEVERREKIEKILKKGPRIQSR